MSMDNKISVDYLQTDNNRVGSNMADEAPRNRKQVQISLSENQLAAIDRAAAELGMNRSEFIRYTFSQVIDQFPQDLMEHGAGLNKSRQL